jgi:hypothetical protein
MRSEALVLVVPQPGRLACAVQLMSTIIAVVAVWFAFNLALVVWLVSHRA